MSMREKLIDYLISNALISLSQYSIFLYQNISALGKLMQNGSFKRKFLDLCRSFPPIFL